MIKCSEDTLAPEVLTKGIFKKVLEAPSHVVLNHVNCWTESHPTLAPIGDNPRGAELRVSELDDGATSSHDKEGNETGMIAVSLTLRLNVNKFATMTYYKPRI